MNLYTYTDNKQQKVVFETTAESISEADEKMVQEIKVDPAKTVWIGCSIKFNV